MVENAGNIDPNRLYQLLVDDISPKPLDASKKGLAASHKGALPPAPSDAPAAPAGALPYAPTSGIPAHEYYAALDAASPRFTAAASRLEPNAAAEPNTAAEPNAAAQPNAADSSVTIYMSPERMMAQAENAALLFTNQQLKDYFETRQQAIKANASQAKSLAQNFRDAADKIAGHAWTACFEKMTVAAIGAGTAAYSFSSSGAGEVDDEVIITDDPDVPIPDDVTNPDVPIAGDDDVKITDDEPEANTEQADAQAADAKVDDGQAVEAADTKVADTQADAKATDAKATDAKAADAQAADAKAADDKSAADAKAAGNKAADAKTADAKTADAKTAAAKKPSWWDKGFAVAPAAGKFVDALAGKEDADKEADNNIGQARGAEITALADAAKAEQSRADGALASLQKQIDGIAQTINDLRRNEADQKRAATIA